jgi:hypothetical protein
MNVSCHAMWAENVTQFRMLGWQNTFILDYKTMCFRHVHLESDKLRLRNGILEMLVTNRIWS